MNGSLHPSRRGGTSSADDSTEMDTRTDTDGPIRGAAVVVNGDGSGEGSMGAANATDCGGGGEGTNMTIHGGFGCPPVAVEVLDEGKTRFVEFVLGALSRRR